MINVGIIGAGHGVRVLAPAIDMIPNARTLGLATRSEVSLDAAKQSLDLEIYSTDWRELVSNPDVDVIAIAVPGSAQTKIAVAALEAGKQVFLEKPLATQLEGAEKIALAAKQCGQNPAVDFIFPTLVPWQSLRDDIGNTDTGAIKDVHLEWRVETYANKHRLDNWKTRSTDGGGTLLNFASHSFHYLEWLFGETASIQATLSKPDDDPRVGDTRVEATITFPNQLQATVEIDAAFPGDACHRLTVQCPDAAFLLENTTRDYVRGFKYSAAGQLAKSVIDDEVESFNGDGRVLATSRILNTFLKTNASPAGLGVHDALKTQRLLDAARRSHHSGRTLIAGQDY